LAFSLEPYMREVVYPAASKMYRPGYECDLQLMYSSWRVCGTIGAAGVKGDGQPEFSLVSDAVYSMDWLLS
jgi:hypothetical protein